MISVFIQRTESKDTKDLVVLAVEKKIGMHYTGTLKRKLFKWLFQIFTYFYVYLKSVVGFRQMKLKCGDVTSSLWSPSCNLSC